MKKIFIGLALLLFVASCTPSEAGIQTAIAQTAAAQPTATSTPIPPTETPTITPSPTQSITPTATQTNTATETDTPEPTATPRPPLSEVILTGDELNVGSDLWLTTGIEQDMGSCPGDCFAKLWGAAGESDATLGIVLIQVDTVEQGELFVSNLTQTEIDSGYIETDIPENISLPETTWIGTKDNQLCYVITLADLVAVVIIFDADEELPTAAASAFIAAFYAELQIAKLAKMGY